jgi:DegV family protein with EDD domain
MSRVSIITDSAAALPPELAAEHGVTVVPMWLTIEGRALREGEVPLTEVLGHPDVTTSGPAPGEFEKLVREQHDGGGVVVLTIASTMSSTYESAVVGARAATGDAADVRVIDTNTAAGAQGLVVLAAAGAAAAGASIDEVEAVARRAMGEVRLVATVPSLDHLVRSGRVPNIAGWAGRRLGLAPLFEFRDGGAHALRPARGLPAALDRIISRWHRDRPAGDGGGTGARLHVAALHAQAQEDADALIARVREEADPVTAFVGPFGAVMVAHTGPGLVGLAWRWDVSASQ